MTYDRSVRMFDEPHAPEKLIKFLPANQSTKANF